jgi:hypothetical protein
VGVVAGTVNDPSPFGRTTVICALRHLGIDKLKMFLLRVVVFEVLRLLLVLVD